MGQHPAIQSLSELLSQPDGAWSLADAAIAIARLETPALDATAVHARLDELGTLARARAGKAQHPRFVIGAVSHVLFHDQDFRVPEASEDSWRPAMIDRALLDRVAAPPLLAILLIEVARRCGVRLAGVALPGVFILRADIGEEPLLFDPARGARPISVDECHRMVEKVAGKPVQFRDGYLRPLTAAQLLARLLGHLKALYWRAGSHEQALSTVQLLLTVRPEDPREIRDRGRLLFLMGRLREAIGAFEAYLHHNPRGEDAEAVRMLLVEARAELLK